MISIKFNARSKFTLDNAKNKRNFQRKMQRNLNASGRYIRVVAKREVKKDNKYDPRGDTVRYRANIWEGNVSISMLDDKKGKRKHYIGWAALPIRKLKESEYFIDPNDDFFDEGPQRHQGVMWSWIDAGTGKYDISSNSAKKWYWLSEGSGLTSAQIRRGMMNLATIKGKKLRKKKIELKKTRTTSEILNTSLEKSSKFLLEIWGRNPLTN